MTSGQRLSPSAERSPTRALAEVLATVSDKTIDCGILVNAVNPGSVNTGYLNSETSDRDQSILDEIMAAFPQVRRA
ncbi:hypothetical protein ABGB12_14050 [Actinocorallia sp. B10E7]|uniref:hypothetical protein n=1 Tax=Actinocorallia sp. B10E7 TaxID=3153558 RepID=UPI00325EDF08